MNTMPWWGWVVVLVISIGVAWHLDRRRRSDILDEQARTLLVEPPGTARLALAFKIGGRRYGMDLMFRAAKLENSGKVLSPRPWPRA